jgi:hypothetical protein
MTPRRPAKLPIVWYPAGWRSRYGDELLAMIEDTSPDERGWRLHLSLAWSGARERLRELGLDGRDAPERERHRVGPRIVFCAWAMCVFAGLCFAKLTEHWQDAGPVAHRSAAAIDSYRLLIALAVAGTALVGVAGVLLIPSLLAAVRRDGMGLVGRVLLAPVAWAVALAGATAGLVGWAHHLSTLQRNGGSWPYLVAYALWASLVAATIAATVRAALRIERHLDIPAPVVEAEVVLAGAVAVCVAGIAASAGTWAVLAAHPIAPVIAIAGFAVAAATALTGAVPRNPRASSR